MTKREKIRQIVFNKFNGKCASVLKTLL